MTRKHFKAIAEIISYGNPSTNEIVKGIAIAMANTFGDYNPNFNRAKFLKAYGVK